MKLPFVLASALFITVACAAVAAPTPEAVVQAQLEAYNARDLDAFAATYADDVQLFQLPDKLLTSGLAQLREHYAKLFRDTRLHAEVVNRMVMGQTVVDHERVRLTLPEGAGTVEAIAIYEVANGKIAKVWFRRGETKLDTAAAAD